jgi:hypothetical protein
MPMSNYLKGKVIDHVFRNTALTPPTTVYVALHTSDPTAAGTPATEVSAAWYARQAVTFAAQSTAGQTSNSNTVTFPAVTGSGLTVTHFSIWDAATLGNMLEYSPLSASKTYSISDVPSWLAGTLSLLAT